MPTAPLHALLARHGGAAGLAAAVRGGEVAAAEPVRAARERIAALDPALHAFTQVLEATGPATGGGSGLELAGLPVAVKDNIDVAGTVTTLGRPVGERPPAARDAEAVARLRGAGAVVVGKTNLPELASLAVTVNAHHGDARNPWDPDRTAGGSSGGSAVAVASGMAAAALATDTGGSALIPAALTGVCGFRPTHGRIGLDGVAPLSPSMDTVGVIASHPADIAAVVRVLDGETGESPAAPGLKGLRVGVLTGWFQDEASDGVLARVHQAVRGLVSAGASARPAETPSAHLVLRHARTIYRAETAASFAGLVQPGRSYAPAVEARRTNPHGPADLARARAFREAWRAELLSAFADADVLIAATTPITAPRLDAPENEATTALIRHAYPFCLAGVPVLSVPAGLDGGLPVGLMLAAPPGEDHRLLALGAVCHDAGLFTHSDT
ncbi:amidase [Actinomadura citrea]|uniref:Aspartyl-tRNA(Asn)/glutamyl-tRNA(Gln) amidotransferase subunit A n=1 Tax=Actinomadura citrea TaxID=46158 RepID=A0A7Y9KEQ4_9ACTN|nr:amidase [Actinomadura citrea]NYE14676.1 aspartyl-tRNA(Asn)/glutamyl-tRNA(Gln) amidotransferase subunit A [Actinomadura citrea]GGT83682.1 amidase [Actinomadura citrea]